MFSSTCYDLRFIKENLKYFITNMGYETILSEDRNIFYNSDYAHKTRIQEVSTCQIFVLIIGGRLSGKYKDTDKSIINKEYDEAIKFKIPVITFVEDNVWGEHVVYQKNIYNTRGKIIYPSVDNIKIFNFIDSVRKNCTNNGFFTFSNYKHIEDNLKKQWASMMFNFLTETIETKKVKQLFDELRITTNKIEYFTKQLSQKVGDKDINFINLVYETIMDNSYALDLREFGIKLSPKFVLNVKKLSDIYKVEEDIYVSVDGDRITKVIIGDNVKYITTHMYHQLECNYNKIQNNILEILKENKYTKEQVLNMIEHNKLY
ncbi:DUF4062 domain-containing protein [Lacrimispora sp. 38-1]|uniref:DUF4062 domain-containing protein n=1 Tax=Lacrimispora sp. 38-1 TaxID=3125778 RepID=UPI003CF3DC55